MSTTNKKPAGDGYYDEWSNSPTNSYTYVDDSTSPTGHDSDTTYISDSLINGARQSFTLESWTVPDGNEITSVDVYWVAKISGTTGKCQPFLRLNSTDAYGTAQSLSTDYVSYSGTVACPSGSWSDLSSLSGLEVGIKCLDAGIGKTIYVRLTQVYIEITYTASATEDTTRIAGLVDTDKTDIQRLANKAIAEKYTGIRLAHDMSLTQAGPTFRIGNSVSFEDFDPDWWDTDYFKRARINFGTNHSGYESGYTANFPLLTGYAEKIASNVIVNEGWPWMCKDDDGNTYLAWLGYPSGVAGTLRIWIKKLTYSTGSWSSAVEVVNSGSSYDTHYAPSMLIDKSGYIHLFYGCHNSQMKYIRSTNPKDISNWNAAGTIGTTQSGSTYPRPVVNSDDDIYVFCREYQSGDSWLVYYKSTDNGVSWGSMVKVVDYSNNYGGNASVYCNGARVDSSDRIHIGITFHDWYLTDNKPRALTYAYADKADGYDRWYEADGTYIVRLSTEHPIYYSDISKIAESPNFPSAGPYYINNQEGLCIDDATQYPYMIAFAWSVPGSDYADLIFYKWTGSAWTSTNLSDVAGCPEMIASRLVSCMYLQNQTVYIYGQVLPTSSEETFGGEIYRWRGTDKGSNWSADFYTMNSAYGWGGVMGLLTNVPDGYYREIAFGRGEDLYWMEDRQYTQVKNDGADVRVVLHQKDEADIELDRLPDQFQKDKSDIFFKINSAAPVGENKQYPHAYKGYYVYWSKYNATNPPNDPNDVYTFYDSFETLNSGDDLTTSADWSGDSGAFKVCEATDSTTHSGAHVNKLWSGRNFVFAVDDGAKEISHTINLDNHYIEFHIVTGADLISGDKGYIELYDGNTSKYIRFGIGYDKFCYLKSGGSWTDASQEADGLRYHTLKLLINSNGVSFWGDGVSILTDDNHITSCTAVKIGYDIAVNENDELVYFDDIKIYKYMATEGTTDLDATEGTDNSATARGAHLVDLEQTATTRIAEHLELQKERRQRIMQELGNGEKTIYQRLMALIAPDKIDTAEIAHNVDVERTMVADLASKLGDPERTTLIKMASTLGDLQRVTLKRLMQSLGDKEKEAVIRLTSIVSGEMTDSERGAHDIDLDKTALAELAATVIGDKKDTIRSAHKMDVDVQRTIRVAEIIAGDKELTARVGNILEKNKISITELANYADLDKETTQLLMNIAVMMKTDIARVAHALDLQFVNVIFGLDKQQEARLNHIADLDKITVTELANWLAKEKTTAAKIANSMGLEAARTAKLAEIILGDKNLVVRVPNKFDGYKTVAERIAHALPLEDTLTTRLACWTDLESTGFARITGLLNLDKTQETRLANIFDFEGSNDIRLAQSFLTDKITTIRMPGYVPLDKYVMVRVAHTYEKDKTLVNRLANNISLEATGDTRLADMIAADKTIFERFSNTMALSHITTVCISNILGLIKTTSSRFANLVEFYIREIYGMHFANASISNFNFADAELNRFSFASPAISNMAFKEGRMKTFSFNNGALSTFSLANAQIT